MRKDGVSLKESFLRASAIVQRHREILARLAEIDVERLVLEKEKVQVENDMDQFERETRERIYEIAQEVLVKTPLQ